MTPEEYLEAVQKAKDDYDREKREVEDQLQRARAKIVKLEKRLALINEQHGHKAAQLVAAFMGVPTVQSLPVHTLVVGGGAVRRRRGERDDLMLELARELASPDVTAKEIEDAWNRRHEDDRISDSTVRSILDRLVRSERLRVSQKGGGQGSGIPTRYTPAS